MYVSVLGGADRERSCVFACRIDYEHVLMTCVCCLCVLAYSDVWLGTITIRGFDVLVCVHVDPSSPGGYSSQH